MKADVRILIASQKVAKLFSFDKEHGFKLLQVYDDEPFHNEIEFTDRPGKSHGASGHAHYAVADNSSQKEDLRHHFVHHVCERLYKDWEAHHFKYLCLFAEAKTLGDLRKYLHKELTNLITYEATANLVGESSDEIIAHLRKIGVGELLKEAI